MSQSVFFYCGRRRKAEKLAAALNSTATLAHWIVCRAKWYGWGVARDQ